MKTARRNPLIVCITLAILAGAAMPSWCVEPAPEDTAVLCKAYLRYKLSQQVAGQITAIGADADDDVKSQLASAAANWSGAATEDVRRELEGQFKQGARQQFESFVAAYTSAEQSQDAAFLQQVDAALQINPPPADYAALRRFAIESFLAPDMNRASSWLGEIQTWMDVRAKNKDTPSLEIWLARGTTTAPALIVQKPKARKVVKPKPVNDLAGAEAEMGEYEAPAEEAGSPLDAFSDMRKNRRDKALEEAQAGMEQVANERRAAEEEYAAKKMSAAQAEAENMKRHADKLASTEQEALEQRKNSWGSRLKSIVGATVGAATGAFAGGVGARAGQEAVNAIFNDR